MPFLPPVCSTCQTVSVIQHRFRKGRILKVSPHELCWEILSTGKMRDWIWAVAQLCLSPTTAVCSILSGLIACNGPVPHDFVICISPLHITAANVCYLKVRNLQPISAAFCVLEEKLTALNPSCAVFHSSICPPQFFLEIWSDEITDEK